MGMNASTSKGITGKSKILLAFDFDHTVVDANTDVSVQDLAADGRIPAEIRQLFSNKCWTDYMQAVFELLHRQGVRQTQYTECMRRIPLTDGMENLLRRAGASANVETVVISDSNSFFIEAILQYRKLSECVDRIFTNPAWFDDEGCLRIRYYHTQTECELSTKNMCKGRILKEYVKEREAAGVHFEKVLFVGDGKNDFCPAVTALGKKGYAFARKGYALENLLTAAEKKLPCTKHVWTSADEICQFLGFDLPDKTKE